MSRIQIKTAREIDGLMKKIIVSTRISWIKGFA
jgi:hypothetical protein